MGGSGLSPSPPGGRRGPPTSCPDLLCRAGPVPPGLARFPLVPLGPSADPGRRFPPAEGPRGHPRLSVPRGCSLTAKSRRFPKSGTDGKPTARCPFGARNPQHRRGCAAPGGSRAQGAPGAGVSTRVLPHTRLEQGNLRRDSQRVAPLLPGSGRGGTRSVPGTQREGDTGAGGTRALLTGSYVPCKCRGEKLKRDIATLN